MPRCSCCSTGLAASLIVGCAGLTLVFADPPKEAPPAPKDASATKQPEATPPAAAGPYVLGFTLKDIDGKDQSLEQYKGKVVLMINVASKCGFTGQYKGLQQLYLDKKEKGLVILGFPANNFGEQEPGTNDEIKEFCTKTYNVTFPMFSKISVKGDDQHPLYKKLASQPAPIGGDPQWNFTKFLVDKQGNVVARFDSRTKPDDQAMLSKIDELLGK